MIAPLRDQSTSAVATANDTSNVEVRAESETAAAVIPDNILAPKRLITLASLPNERLMLIIEALPSARAYGDNHQMLSCALFPSLVSRQYELHSVWQGILLSFLSRKLFHKY